MPDIWTKHPDIVRDLLTEAGFKCGVEPRFLKGRDPAWTCAYDGKTMRGDLYIHRADQLKGELRAPRDETVAPSLAGPGIGGGELAVVGAVMLGTLAVRAWRRGRPGRVSHANAMPWSGRLHYRLKETP